MEIKMVDDDAAIINRIRHEFDAGEVVTVPDWVGRSFIDKGTAVEPEEDTEEDQSEDEAFANPDERETKGANLDGVVSPVEAYPTTEGSSWYRFVDANGDVVPNEDGDEFKVQGKTARDKVLEALNDGTS